MCVSIHVCVCMCTHLCAWFFHASREILSGYVGTCVCVLCHTHAYWTYSGHLSGIIQLSRDHLFKLGWSKKLFSKTLVRGLLLLPFPECRTGRSIIHVHVCIFVYTHAQVSVYTCLPGRSYSKVRVCIDWYACTSRWNKLLNAEFRYESCDRHVWCLVHTRTDAQNRHVHTHTENTRAKGHRIDAHTQAQK
jgi:hypothetical protein